MNKIVLFLLFLASAETGCENSQLFPLTVSDVLGFICLFLISALANSSGVGGGALMTIILIVIFDIEVSQAISLSQVCVFSGTLIGTIMRLSLRHPTRDRPAIDYELLLLIISPLLLGTTIGVYVQIFLYEWIILGLLTLVLSWITYESIRASIKAYALENHQLVASINSEPESPQVHCISSEEIIVPLKKIILTEKKKIPPLIVIYLTIIYVYNILGTLLRGSKKVYSIVNIDTCSTSYVVFSLVFLFSLVALTIFMSFILIRRTREKINIGYDFDDFDMIWKMGSCTVCSFSAFFAGLCAGMLSIGGGIVMSPIMLKLGMRPQVVVPTSSVLYVLSSSLAVILYSVEGDICYSYAISVSMATFTGSIVGILFIRKLVKRYQRASLMVIAMTILLALSTIIVPTYGIVNYDNLKNDNSPEAFCNAI